MAFETRRVETLSEVRHQIAGAAAEVFTGLQPNLQTGLVVALCWLEAKADQWCFFTCALLNSYWLSNSAMQYNNTVIIVLLLVILLEEQVYLVCVPSVSDTIKTCWWFSSTMELVGECHHQALLSLILLFCKVGCEKEYVYFQQKLFYKSAFQYFLLVLSCAGLILNRICCVLVKNKPIPFSDSSWWQMQWGSPQT